jgi:hypothetical protein
MTTLLCAVFAVAVSACQWRKLHTHRDLWHAMFVCMNACMLHVWIDHSSACCQATTTRCKPMIATLTRVFRLTLTSAVEELVLAGSTMGIASNERRKPQQQRKKRQRWHHQLQGQLQVKKIATAIKSEYPVVWYSTKSSLLAHVLHR